MRVCFCFGGGSARLYFPFECVFFFVYVTMKFYESFGD